MSRTEVPLKIRLSAEKQARSEYGYAMDDRVDARDKPDVEEFKRSLINEAMHGRGCYTVHAFPAY